MHQARKHSKFLFNFYKVHLSEAVRAAGGYDNYQTSAQYRGRGARMVGTFNLSQGEIIQILVGQEGGMRNSDWSPGVGGAGAGGGPGGGGGAWRDGS